MRLISVVGARPQFIKLAPVSRALRQWHEEIIVHTGQHYDDTLSATFFEELAIPAPDYNLGVGSGRHGMQTGRMLAAIEDVLIQVKPDGVIVFGDTNSTLAAALAAVKLHIPVVHIEAGLRSFNRTSPEEINRVVTDHVSGRLFPPTETGREQLQREGIVRGVEVVGDVMYDVLLQAQPLVEERVAALLPTLGVARGQYLLVTVHHAVNTDSPDALARIAQALNDLKMPVIFPVHPRTRKSIEQHSIVWGGRVRLVEPVGYLSMLALQQAAHRVLTDSGGVQKEAFLLGVPCITLREDTEWPETVEAGWNVLTGSRPEAIMQAVYRPRPQESNDNPFGVGDAALRIAQSLRTEPLTL